ncbi:MAG TPA: carbamate kinase [Candidatus Limnocylindrales bacterium]
MSLVAVALGGNALIRRGEDGSTAVQRRNLVAAARALADLDALGHQLILTHGNGPQVGFLSIEAEAARDIVPPPPLDVLVAESQGQIGYLLAQALSTELIHRGRRRRVVAMLTQTIVDPADPAFAAPSKPVGPMYDEATARALAREHAWTIAPDGGGWRRVVPSPRPLDLVEADTVKALVGGTIVIASGGGGIPVRRVNDGAFAGVEAVVDKDLAAVVLAIAVGADALLLLTDVPAVHLCWGTPRRIPLRRLTLAGAAAGIRDGSFPPGSMGPKVAAAAQFVERTGKLAAIGSLADAPAILDGRAGTQLVVELGRPDALGHLPREAPSAARAMVSSSAHRG